MSFKFRYTNHDQFIRELDDNMKLRSQAGAQALYQVACLIMEDAKANAPVDTTMLRESGYVELPTASGHHNWRLELGFGGPAGQYALEQHEEMGLSHRVGGPKFLTNAMNKYSSSFVQIMRQYMLQNGDSATIRQNTDIKTNPWQPPTFGSDRKV